MSQTITVPAGTRITNLGTGRTEMLLETLTVRADYRIDDDTWVWVRGGLFFEVKLNPGD